MKNSEQENKIQELFISVPNRIADALNAFNIDSNDEILWRLIKSKEDLEDLIKLVGYPRYEPVKSSSVYYPPLSTDILRCCPYCGRANCGSDHK